MCVEIYATWKTTYLIVNIDYNTKISITDTTRANTGIWKIKAVNAHGEDEADVEITVLCKSKYDKSIYIYTATIILFSCVLHEYYWNLCFDFFIFSCS